MHAELDPVHKDSPLCACKTCNDEWLARRNQPMSKKHVVTRLPVDPTNKQRFVEWCKRLKVVTIELQGEHNPRIATWKLQCTQTGYTFVAGFDLDVQFVLTRMEHPVVQSLQGAVSALYAPSTPSVVTSTKTGATMTGGPWCFMCGEPGGLPSPNMKGAAKLLGLRVHFTWDDARMQGALLHPGRCRKRLRQLIDTAKTQQGVKSDTCYAAVGQATRK